MRIIVRTYTCSDAELLERAHEVVDHLAVDLPKFVEFDQEFTPERLQRFQDVLAAAEGTTSDRFVQRKQVQLTADMQQQFQRFKQLLRHLRYFVKKAFRDAPEKAEDFRLRGLNLSRMSQAQQIVFLRDLAEVVRFYQPALQAAGCKEDLAAEAHDIYQRLREANKEQEKHKSQRLLETDDRIISLNKVNRQLVDIHNASLHVFAGQPSHQHKYRLPRSSSSRAAASDLSSEAETEVALEALPGKAVAYEGPLTADTQFVLSHVGEQDLLFYLVEDLLQDLPEAFVRLSPGMNTRFSAAQLGWSAERSLRLVVDNRSDRSQLYSLEVGA